EKLDAVVLVSGDGDFTEVLKYVRSRGIRAEVMAFRKTTSAKLLDETDTFHDLGADPARFLIPVSKPIKPAGKRPMGMIKSVRKH
ncbi:MAG TPA: NYN domain-containing protein, partial [Candidatus Gracilibacteria bacterium]|nr:NYN domain-containing protein [Candidatus Gracilibacteria bacterium]